MWNCIIKNCDRTLNKSSLQVWCSQWFICAKYNRFDHIYWQLFQQALYSVNDNHELSHYMDMIVSNTTFNNSSQHPQYFGYNTNIGSVFLYLVIKCLKDIHMIFCDCCENSGHKTDYCITRGSNFWLPIIPIKKNQYNTLNGDKPKDTPQECTKKKQAVHFTSATYKPQTSTENRNSHVVLELKGKLNNYTVDNGGV